LIFWDCKVKGDGEKSKPTGQVDKNLSANDRLKILLTGGLSILF